MRRLLPLAAVLLLPIAARAQGPGIQTPVLTDLRKVPIGAWSEYQLEINKQIKVKARWALVGRDAQSNTLEGRMEGAPFAMMGGTMLVKMILAPDPTAVETPVQKLIMQMGSNEPIEMPLDAPGMRNQKFEKPDPKKLIGKETLTLANRAIPTKHYRDSDASTTWDTWVSDSIQPLGIVKMHTTPKPGAVAPTGQPATEVSMVLIGMGTGAKAEITKASKPMDPAMMQQLMGARGRSPSPSAPARGSSPATKAAAPKK